MSLRRSGVEVKVPQICTCCLVSPDRLHSALAGEIACCQIIYLHGKCSESFICLCPFSSDLFIEGSICASGIIVHSCGAKVEIDDRLF